MNYESIRRFIYAAICVVVVVGVAGITLNIAHREIAVDACPYTEKTNVIRIAKGDTLKLGMNGEWFVENDKPPSEEMQVYVVRVLTYKSSCQLKVVPE